MGGSKWNSTDSFCWQPQKESRFSMGEAPPSKADSLFQHCQPDPVAWVKRLWPRNQYLHDKYGGDIAIVEARVESKRFDWNTFLDSDCAKGAML